MLNDASGNIITFTKTWLLRVFVNPITVKMNTAPYFNVPLKDLRLEEQDSLFYQKPKILDNEGDDVTVKVDLGTAFRFVDYKEGTFRVTPK